MKRQNGLTRLLLVALVLVLAGGLPTAAIAASGHDDGGHGSATFTHQAESQGVRAEFQVMSLAAMYELGGSIGVESRWGEGATFSVAVPRDDPRQRVAESASDRAVSHPGTSWQETRKPYGQ